MKWRIAKKVRAAIDTPRESAYTDHQYRRAFARYDRLRSSKLDREHWHALMAGMGAEGRARMALRRGRTADALSILMNVPESEWKGDWSLYEEFKREVGAG